MILFETQHVVKPPVQFDFPSCYASVTNCKVDGWWLSQQSNATPNPDGEALTGPTTWG